MYEEVAMLLDKFKALQLINYSLVEEWYVFNDYL